MRTIDLIGSAIANTFRSKTRTILTILAIFVGAFTLTLTSGLGTGINAFIDDTVTSIGASDVMTVTTTPDGATGVDATDPVEYNPDAIASGQPGPPGTTVVALTPEDLDTIAGIEGVTDVVPTRSIRPDYIQAGDGTQYVIGVGSLIAGQTIPLEAGAEPDDSATELQLVLPVAFVEPMGLGDPESAIGQTVSIALTDAERTQHVVDATIVGVAEEGLASPSGAAIVPNAALSDELFDAQSIGLPADDVERYAQASVFFDPASTAEEVQALKDRLADAGYTGSTVADQLGLFKTVIDGIVLVLNAFAIIALLAASFGIVNTLYMSVQERTREIGLMKAMGMGNGRVFSLFSLEAAFIGFLGSAIGVAVAMLAGSALSSALSTSLLADLPGLTLIAFDPVSIAGIIIVVMLIAFLAGTLPAARAARADPVESLRYE
ncbi:ABC transporter permease [Microbacterium sp. SSM24]|uniref:ABC transporter permease n=1 Tax=Microbacterium sp. SSM24 TaxID=2991714 RepID=UPI0022277639|nr:ABC transporter permease [Microbacterium sp. SSM24]MCW3493370.1 ABC transporter permease [Microbacterium sp. SSM24]